MKVGILTFHNAYNYGALLQTYATQEVLRSMGLDVEVIDYRNRSIKNAYRYAYINKEWLLHCPKRKFWKLPSYIYYGWKGTQRILAFRRFSQLHLSVSVQHYEQGFYTEINGYDAILFGSDQIWNRKFTDGLDDIYWGNFKTDKNTAKILWAVSMNYMEVNAVEKEYISKSIKNFTAFSVREEELRLFLNRFTSEHVSLLIDPTLILSKESWEKLVHPVQFKHYILVYALGAEPESVKKAQELSQATGKKIVVLSLHKKHYKGCTTIFTAGPNEFLSLICHADFIISTSFHGTVFSTIFEKNFVSLIPHSETNTRIKNYLLQIDLESRIIDELTDISSLPLTSYGGVASKIRMMALKNTDYLKKNLHT